MGHGHGKGHGEKAKNVPFSAILYCLTVAQMVFRQRHTHSEEKEIDLSEIVF